MLDIARRATAGEMKARYWRRYARRMRRYSQHLLAIVRQQRASRRDDAMRRVFKQQTKLREAMRRAVLLGAGLPALEGEAGEGECVLCFNKELHWAFLPCGHLCLCSECVDSIGIGPGSRCPLCRAVATSVVRIYAA